jgi:hypothetical protein
MRLTIAAAAIAWGALVLGTVSGADAQPRKRQVAYTPPGPGSTTIVSRDERGRVRTKILVQKRSYLDGGTEVMPGDIQTNQTNLVNSFSYNPSRAHVPNDTVWPSRPIPDPFYLPGKNNPFFN